MNLPVAVGGIIVSFSRYIGHQRWQVLGAIALQTACVGAMSTASMDNPTKSIIIVFQGKYAILTLIQAGKGQGAQILDVCSTLV